MVEEWKDISDYEGLYKISNLGNVLSVKRNKQLAKSDSNGYDTVNLSKNGKTTKCKVHRLVAINFIENIDNKPIVNHIDENKKNNRVSNLEWVTARENNIYGTRLNKVRKPIKAIDIATGEFNIYESQTKCARMLNLNHSNINACLHRNVRQIGGYVFEQV